MSTGTYDATALNGLFGTGSQFTGLGSLTVIPEPDAYAALLGAGGLLVALGSRGRQGRQAA